MGTLTHGLLAVEFEDRLLTHLQIVIVTRFLRNAPFLTSWADSVAIGSGRSSIWLTPLTPVYFRFSGSRVPSIDPAWLSRLSASADSSTGLIVTGEDERVVNVEKGSVVAGHW